MHGESGSPYSRFHTPHFSRRMTQRVAIVGAGIQGACIAIELARRGALVTLFDRESEPLTQASVSGEGKLHCGFLYAKDTSFRSADLLWRGALSFLPLVEEWLERPLPEGCLSHPFVYAVHRDSMLSVDDVRAHLLRVAAVLEQSEGRDGLTYHRSPDLPWVSPMPQSEVESIFTDRIVAGFQTAERAVDPEAVARLIRARLAEDEQIEFLAEHEVTAVTGHAGRFMIQVGADRHGPFDQVVNAAWAGRLLLDASRGLVPDRPWLFRYKFGATVDATDLDLGGLPSTSIVLGPFGDVVRRSDGSAHLSWYPIGRVASSNGLVAPEPLPDEDRAGMISSTVDALAEHLPAVARLHGRPAESVGGVIFSWGDRDIDSEVTELHNRYDIGPMSVDGYHTVDTGKLTMAPYFAMHLAARVMS